MTKSHAITDPFKYLENDHKAVAKLLDELEKTTERAVKTRDELFAELNDSLTLHANIEEHVLYPALEHLKTTHDITLEAFEEHHVVKILLEELSSIPQDTEQWTAKLKVLKENIEHHVEEEEDDMFTKARKALDRDKLDALALEMEKYITELI